MSKELPASEGEGLKPVRPPMVSRAGMVVRRVVRGANSPNKELNRIWDEYHGIVPGEILDESSDTTTLSTVNKTGSSVTAPNMSNPEVYELYTQAHNIVPGEIVEE